MLRIHPNERATKRRVPKIKMIKSKMSNKMMIKPREVEDEEKEAFHEDEENIEAEDEVIEAAEDEVTEVEEDEVTEVIEVEVIEVEVTEVEVGAAVVGAAVEEHVEEQEGAAGVDEAEEVEELAFRTKTLSLNLELKFEATSIY